MVRRCRKSWKGRAMLRVRLKADGRLVEILPDGSERAISFSQSFSDDQPPAAPAKMVPIRIRTVCGPPPLSGRDLRPQCAGPYRPDPGRLRGPHRRAGRNRTQLGTGQAFAARTGAGAPQGHRTGARRRLCGLGAKRADRHTPVHCACRRNGAAAIGVLPLRWKSNARWPMLRRGRMTAKEQRMHGAGNSARGQGHRKSRRADSSHRLRHHDAERGFVR